METIGNHNLRTFLSRDGTGPFFDASADRLRKYLRDNGGSMPVADLPSVHPTFHGMVPGLAEAMGLLDAASARWDRAGGGRIVLEIEATVMLADRDSGPWAAEFSYAAERVLPSLKPRPERSTPVRGQQRSQERSEADRRLIAILGSSAWDGSLDPIEMMGGEASHAHRRKVMKRLVGEGIVDIADGKASLTEEGRKEFEGLTRFIRDRYDRAIRRDLEDRETDAVRARATREKAHARLALEKRKAEATARRKAELQGRSAAQERARAKAHGKVREEHDRRMSAVLGMIRGFPRTSAGLIRAAGIDGKAIAKVVATLEDRGDIKRMWIGRQRYWAASGFSEEEFAIFAHGLKATNARGGEAPCPERDAIAL